MPKNNKIIIVLVLPVLLVLLILIIVNRKQANKSDKIQNRLVKIGVLLPQSGNSASQAEKIQKGLDLALDEINRDGKKLELFYQDTEADPKKAVSAYLQLKTTQKISAVITWGSSIAMALLPMTNQNKIIQMGVATATPKYRTLQDFNFRNYPSAESEAEFLADKLKNQFHFSSAAIIYMNNDYGNGFAKTFTDNWIKLAGQTPPREQFDLGGADFRAQLAKIKQNNPQVILLAAYAKEGGLILKQARQLDMQSQFASPSGIFGAELAEAGGKAAEGLLVSDSIPELADDSPQSLKDFATAFQKKYGHAPGSEEMYAIRSFDALKILATAFAACPNVDTGCAKNQLQQIKLQGAEGNLSFDEYGDIKANFHLVIFKNGKPVKFQK